MMDNWDNYNHYNLSGRMLAALFDLATIVVVFFLGRELANRNVGLLAAGLYALTPFAIQNSHFFIVDPFVAFFATFALLFAVRSAKFGRWRDFALAGLGAGLAAACKITAIAMLPVIVLAIGVYAWPAVKPYIAPWWTGNEKEYEPQRNGPRLDRAVLLVIAGSALALIIAFIAFRIAMPYAFKSPSLADFFSWKIGHFGSDPQPGKDRAIWSIGFPYPNIMNQHWIKDQLDQRQLLSGDASFPPNVQWIGRSKWLWPLQQMVSWGMGPALGITAWIGVAFSMVWAFRKREGMWLVPLAWVLGYFLFMGAAVLAVHALLPAAVSGTDGVRGVRVVSRLALGVVRRPPGRRRAGRTRRDVAATGGAHRRARRGRRRRAAYRRHWHRVLPHL